MDSFLSQLRDVNLTRCQRWHGPDGVNQWPLEMWGLAAAGEMGETCNVIKKIRRQEDNLAQGSITNLAELQVQLSMEIGDTLVYLDLLAARAGLDLEDCIRSTFNRVSVRQGFPERL